MRDPCIHSNPGESGSHTSRPHSNSHPHSTAATKHQSKPMTNETKQLSTETSSRRYGNEQTINETYRNPYHPRNAELRAALADTQHLSEKEAFAFVNEHFDSYSGVPGDQITEETAQKHGFDTLSEYHDIRDQAREKIADAIWIYELIDAYRSPDFPDTCGDCGSTLGGTWVEPDEAEHVVCRDCAAIRTGDEDLRDKRLAVINDVRDLLSETAERTDDHVNHLQQPINVAHDCVLDDAEFNHSIRLALHGLRQSAADATADVNDLIDRIDAYTELLPQKAALPPQAELSR